MSASTPGAAAQVLASSFSGNRETSVVSYGPGTSVTLTDTTIDATKNSGVGYGRGVLVDEGTVTLERVTVAASTDIEASITQLSALENHGVAVLAITKGRIDLQNAWIADTAADGTPGGPGRAVTAQDGGLMTILGLVAQRSRQAGILVAAGGASLALRSSRIEDVAAGDDEALGHGLTALEGSSLVVDDVTVRRCAAVGLVFDAASGTVRASRITDNAVGIFAQGGSELLQVAVVPEAPVDRQVSISTDTVFTDNATRVGSRVVPVPSPL